MARQVEEPREPLPLNATVKDFEPFLPKGSIKKLTPAARTLTKKDLLLLDAGQFTRATKKLTTEDLHSLRVVFAQNSLRKAGGSGGGYYCCCCCCYFCCCCTAVSVTRPVKNSR
jgi:hypothetical protein